MSVILEIIDTPEAAQGVRLTYILCKLKNSGTEDIKNLFLKVVDSTVFHQLIVYHAPSATSDCLNASAKVHNYTDGNYIFPAGTEKVIRFITWHIKNNSPTGNNNVNTNFGYELL